jgi:hypothetical protein
MGSYTMIVTWIEKKWNLESSIKIEGIKKLNESADRKISLWKENESIFFLLLRFSFTIFLPFSFRSKEKCKVYIIRRIPLILFFRFSHSKWNIYSPKGEIFIPFLFLLSLVFPSLFHSIIWRKWYHILVKEKLFFFFSFLL